MKKIYLLTSLFLATATTTLPMHIIKKIDASISNFSQESLDTHTYDFNSPKHRKFLAFTYLLPENIGQYYLYRQRQNMKKFLEQNEKDALENLKKEHNIDDEWWNKATEQYKKNYALHLEALADNSNTRKATHDKNIPAQWIPLFESASKKLGINYKNLNIVIDDTIDAAGMNRNEILSENNDIPAITTLNKSNLETYANAWKKINVDVISGVIAHEFTHAKKGHTLFISTLSDILSKQAPEVPQKPIYTTDSNQYISEANKYMADVSEYVNKTNIFIKKQNQLMNLQSSIGLGSPSLLGRIYSESMERTADTLLACDYADSARNALCASYEFNKNDIKNLNMNWQMSKEIQQSRDIVRSTQKNLNKLSNLIPSITFNPSPFKKSSTMTFKPAQFTTKISTTSTSE